ncbi:MAG: DUF2238 domain-containing protein, partial [Mariprofundaceae bacterium]
IFFFHHHIITDLNIIGFMHYCRVNSFGLLHLGLSLFGFSGFYELIEWWVTLATGENAEAFLGTQGYIWDTQSDMGLALLGAILGLLTLRKLHDQ